MPGGDENGQRLLLNEMIELELSRFKLDLVMFNNRADLGDDFRMFFRQVLNSSLFSNDDRENEKGKL